MDEVIIKLNKTQSTWTGLDWTGP